MIDVSAWSQLHLIEPVAEGNRNEVWRGELAGMPVAVRRSRRSRESLQWEVNLIEHLASLNFVVPQVCPTDDGEMTADGIVVQQWIAGAPPASTDDWRRVANELERLHALVPAYPQRPGCCTVVELRDHRRSVDADLDAMPTAEQHQVIEIFAGFDTHRTALIHGDPDPSNIRLTADGSVGLLDWDESRVDVTWHDLSNLGITVLDEHEHLQAQRLSNAWEAANGWVAEPAYARRRLAELKE